MVKDSRRMTILTFETEMNLLWDRPQCNKILAMTIVCVTALLPNPSWLIFVTGFVYVHLARKDNNAGIHAVYELCSEIGKGSFATLMKGIHKQTGQWYAIKIRHKKRGAMRSVFEKAFGREVAILEKLDHPHICKLKEVYWGQGEDDTCEYI